MPKIVANEDRESRKLHGCVPILRNKWRSAKLFAAFSIQHVDQRVSTMTRAFWAGKLIAESDGCVVVEGNQYFPATAVKKEFLKSSAHTSLCPWKGTAHYYHVEVDGMRNDNAAWFYPEPKPAAQEISGRIAFWKGVRVEA
jgi:uncharacterized protein (DUF427 family)